MDFPIENGDFPLQNVSLPEGRTIESLGSIGSIGSINGDVRWCKQECGLMA